MAGLGSVKNAEPQAFGELSEKERELANIVFETQDNLQDKLFVLGTAWKMLQRTYPWAKDEKGYTFPDAWLFRDIILRTEELRLKDENMEWMRRHLLKYERQIRGFGLDFDKLNRIRMAEKAIYWKTVGVDSKLISVTVDVKKNARIIAKYRNYKTRQRELLRADLTRGEAIDLLKRLDNPWGTAYLLEKDGSSTVHIVYKPCPFAEAIEKELRGSL